MWNPESVEVVSGPVIIENGKVLLNRALKNGILTPWLFPGGHIEEIDTSLEETAKREAKEEMGIDIEIIQPLRTLFLKRSMGDGHIVMAHYLAKRIGEIEPGDDTAEWGWHDITLLPENCARNVVEIIENIKDNT